MFLILRNRNFLLVWLGQVLSQAGTRMYQIAIMWWMLTTMNGKGSELAYFLIISSLPSLLFVKHIGNLIEKVDSKKIFLFAELSGFLTILGVIYLIHLGLFSIVLALITGFLLSLYQAFIDPTLFKSVPELCPKEDSTMAVAFITSTQSLANFAGAILGALLIEMLGIIGVTAINGISYLLCVLFIFRVRFSPMVAADDSSGTYENLKTFELLNRMPLIKKILFGFGLANFFLNPILITLPVYTKNALNENASILGMLEGALWIGILIGGFVSKYVNIFNNNPIKIVMGALLLQGLMLFASGMIIHTLFFITILLWIGLLLGIINVKIIDYFQRNVNEAYRGRFFAILQAVITFTFPIAYFLFGHLIDHILINQICMIQATGLLFVGIYFYLLGKMNRAIA
ncbi:MAG: hypothetical protein A2381_19085 [Bdellovibrionales bacterium RIFOXYB1_FULL_37_110]|nr:MAG: hypothetical protein A2181_09355 [Bdellovibrionales bacterium RIFOXYA1_FULL_38_20]OFZ49485.1 MAG: hypothetical protein A2417_04235 [Bdellovibrionales bacterium RIFOXYC1_FULL_37_79]OFZ58639.1 MAG: hypothetical protein A2381_19085 [Bdellovibrionales bacterium RIFOXYB1_FULL_37_110]OFZ63380.1 MAG: hypothetical protein A2577_17345 [Bdellovibrionales bacterium RIFOXYD1_FULL_36_51]